MLESEDSCVVMRACACACGEELSSRASKERMECCTSYEHKD